MMHVFSMVFLFLFLFFNLCFHFGIQMQVDCHVFIGKI